MTYRIILLLGNQVMAILSRYEEQVSDIIIKRRKLFINKPDQIQEEPDTKAGIRKKPYLLSFSASDGQYVYDLTLRSLVQVGIGFEENKIDPNPVSIFPNPSTR